MRKLILLFAETALELVPDQIAGNIIVREEAKKRHMPSEKMLLDSNKHNLPMKDLADFEKRGRPDILHFSLLTALESIANKNSLIEAVYVHTYSGKLMKINPETRLPRIYNRFCGIMEQVLGGGKNQFISIADNVDFKKALEAAMAESKPAIFFFNEGGESIKLGDYLKLLEKELDSKTNSPILLVFGCFAHGTFSESNKKILLKSAGKEIRFGDKQLTVWTLVSNAINAYELGSGL